MKEAFDVSKIFMDCNKNRILKDILVDNSISGIVVCDGNGIIQFANAEAVRIIGFQMQVENNLFEVEQLKGSKILSGVSASRNGKVVELKNIPLASEIPPEKKYVNVKIHAINNLENTSAENIILMIEDITDETNLRLELRRTYLTGLEAMAGLVDAKDAYTGKHSKHVYDFVSKLCDFMGDCETEMREKILIAASFHDIGKIGIPDEILKKDGKLTLDEYEFMKKHPIIGSEIISKINGFEDVARIIRHHHERWDGYGYPDGLVGNEIPYGSQIIAIADTLDAIVSDRVYRKSRGMDVAQEILLQERGKQFNPDLVNLFLEALNGEE